MTPPLKDRERCERAIQAAFRSVALAQSYAEIGPDEGLAHDLLAIKAELHRLSESLTGPRRRRRQAEAEAFRQFGS